MPSLNKKKKKKHNSFLNAQKVDVTGAVFSYARVSGREMGLGFFCTPVVVDCVRLLAPP